MASPVKGVFPCNCHHCRLWTAIRISHNDRHATLTCTVCNETVKIDMKAKEFKAFIKSINAFSQLTAAQQPQILDLYTPGNSASLSGGYQ